MLYNIEIKNRSLEPKRHQGYKEEKKKFRKKREGIWWHKLRQWWM